MSRPGGDPAAIAKAVEQIIQHLVAETALLQAQLVEAHAEIARLKSLQKSADEL